VAAAIAACPAAVDVTATSSAATVTVTQAKPGPFLAVGTTNNTGIFSWGAVSGGSAGTNTCPSATTGTYATSSSPTTLASNLSAAINLCPATAGVTAGSSSSTTTITSRTPGSPGNTISGASNDTGIFSWAAAINGIDGTNTCPTLASATFATSSTTATLASNLAAAINACSGANVTGSSSASTVTVTAITPGTGGNSIGSTNTLSGFAWTGSTLTGGSDGVNTGTNFS